VLVPLLLAAATKAGAAAEAAALTVTSQALGRDKNAALEALAKVGSFWRSVGIVDGAPAWLSGPHALPLPQVRLLAAQRLAIWEQPGDSSSLRLDGAAATSPAFTSGSGNAPSSSSLAAEYERVVVQLKERSEKGHMILALNEVRWRQCCCCFCS
jgi:hypothetical protein